MKTQSILLLAALAVGLTGCDRSRTGAGLHLPAGDAERGRNTFVALKCYECHRVADTQLPAPTIGQDAVIMLGGEVTRLRSYGELVTAIIHPDKSRSALASPTKDAAPPKHPMPAVNREMTVEQLVDLVAFLHPRYRQLPPMYDNSLIR